jgi:hypothetical protein
MISPPAGPTFVSHILPNWPSSGGVSGAMNLNNY